jgi:signal transduction histidine kinase
LGSILVLFSLGIFYRLKTRHQKEKLKEIYNTETRISQKVHDELANDMYQLLQKIHQKSSLPKNNIVFELDNIYKRTRDISHEISSVNLDHKYYYLELKGMLDTYQNENVTITTIGLTKDILSTINDLKKIIVLRVLQELMINMEKHSKATQVVVSFKKSNNRIQVSYVDNGLGFNKKKHFKSNGLQNVENRIRAIKGNITFDTERTQGISITISLPI